MTHVTLQRTGEWELGEVIGSGGTGTVHVATSDTYPGQHVIKLMPNSGGAVRELFVTDDLTGRPNIIPVLDKGITADQTHLALLMPKADGSLRDFMNRVKGPTPTDQALPILVDIVHGLISLSDIRWPEQQLKEVVHRDLKPDNILYLNGKWCISDFGIARYLAENTGPDTRRYHMTHEYAAPEQWRGETATSQADIYAFGIIAYELLTGERPFDSNDLRNQHLNYHPAPVQGVPAALAIIVAECLHKIAGVRPSPARLLQKLEADVTKPKLVRPGLGALQSLSLDEKMRLMQIETRAKSQRERDEERNALFNSAWVQWKEITDLLKETILQHIPGCKSSRFDDNGWELEFRAADLSWPSLSIQRQPCEQDPFDVVASCSITVSSSVRMDITIFTYLFWFCDARERGCYLWQEVIAPVGVNGHYDTTKIPIVNGYNESNEHGPRELVSLENRDDFIDRWVLRFVDASLGKLTSS